MKRNTFIRALCAALCAALFLGTFAILFSAANAADVPAAAETAVLAATEQAAPKKEVSASPTEGVNFFKRAFDWFFRTVGFLGFTLDPYQFTIINQNIAGQWLLGFNDLYDKLPWIMNVWTDTFKCQFNYGGKDWRVQFWKGGYGTFLATGGEVGDLV